MWGTGKLLSRFQRLPPRVRTFGPSAVGLALIPLAVPHIDEGVNRWMDRHLRPHLGLHSVSLLRVCWLSVMTAVDSIQVGPWCCCRQDLLLHSHVVPGPLMLMWHSSPCAGEQLPLPIDMISRQLCKAMRL